MMRLAALSAVLTASLMTTSLPVSQGTAAPGDLLETQRVNVNVRAEPTTDADVVTRVNAGERIIEIERQSDWYLVDLPDQGSQGWIYGPLLATWDETPATASRSRRADAYTTAATYDQSLIGNPERGERLFYKCGACHTTVEGIHADGPSLVGVFGRAPAQAEGYRYSGALQSFAREGAVWDEATLDRFIQRPGRVVKGTTMPFSGLRDPQDRRDVIAFLQDLSR